MPEDSVPCAVVGVPAAGLYRVGRGPDVFEPIDWVFALEDGTFGNRFDDPAKNPDPTGQRGPISEQERFRVLYCSTQRAGAYGEVIARFRPDISLLASAEAIEDDEPLHPALRTKSVPVDWRDSRRLGHIMLSDRLRFVDLHHGATLTWLRTSISPLLKTLGLSELDRSHITGDHRQLTQEIARYIYESTDAQGNPRFAGIRYLSRLHQDWELWAIFHDRLEFEQRGWETIFPDDPGLLEALNIFGMDPPAAF